MRMLDVLKPTYSRWLLLLDKIRANTNIINGVSIRDQDDSARTSKLRCYMLLRAARGTRSKQQKRIVKNDMRTAWQVGDGDWSKMS